jgi:two-component system, chemotaxis family, chemotaxis protein CheY
LESHRECRCSVAIVDDERSLVEVYKKIFELRGIPVYFVAYDGEEAVRQFAEHNPRPSVVLMDYRMPGVNGIQATRRILGMDSEVKVIFISADDSVREDAIRAGAVMFMQKPASVREIIAAVEGMRDC